MAVTDLLKTAGYIANRAANPFNPAGVLSTFDRLKGLGKKPTPVGFEPLNPEAAAIQQKRLATNAAGPLPLPSPVAAPASQRISIKPRPIQQPTVGVQAPVDPATQQLQQEAANLAQYGSAVAPNQPVAAPQQAPAAQGQSDEEQPTYTPTPSVSIGDAYRQSYEQLGLGSIQGQIEVVGKDLEELQNKKIDEISLVNENPWLTEGQRQDRVNAVERRYQQREANLMNRLQLFQSTFEQGREEARFLTQEQLRQQERQQDIEADMFVRSLDMAEKRSEAERKLAEQGNEILSVADARELGVPYGTTAKEARELGVVPQEKIQGGIVGEYQFYAQQEEKSGRQPLTFDEYQTRDANRKLRAASGSGGTGDLGKLLTVEEALKLGVPYGTTKGEAVGRFATGASGEAAKLQGIVQTLPTEINQLRSIMASADRGKLAKILAGLEPATNRLIDQVADKVGRLRSGGAINKDEENRFKGQIIRKSDLITGDTSSAVSALDGLAEEARQVAQGIRVGSNNQSQGQGGDPLGVR